MRQGLLNEADTLARLLPEWFKISANISQITTGIMLFPILRHEIIAKVGEQFEPRIHSNRRIEQRGKIVNPL